MQPVAFASFVTRLQPSLTDGIRTILAFFNKSNLFVWLTNPSNLTDFSRFNFMINSLKEPINLGWPFPITDSFISGKDLFIIEKALIASLGPLAGIRRPMNRIKFSFLAISWGFMSRPI